MVRIYLYQSVKTIDSVKSSLEPMTFGDECRFNLFSFFSYFFCFSFNRFSDACFEDSDVREFKILIKLVRK